MAEGLFDGSLQNQQTNGAESRRERVHPPASAAPSAPFAQTSEEPIYAGRLRAVGRDLFVLSLPSPVARLPNVLTVAERNVAALVLDGLSNRCIAERRGTSVRTVANQIASVFRKLNVTGRAELGDVTAARNTLR